MTDRYQSIPLSSRITRSNLPMVPSKIIRRGRLPSFFDSVASLLVIVAFLFLNNMKSVLRPSRATLPQSESILTTSVASLDTQSSSVPVVQKKMARDSSLPTYRQIPPRQQAIQRDIVKPGDYIYYKTSESWDSSPIVIESHKLVFFTIPKVGCTVWKQLFRRMMNITDWQSQDHENFLPHNPDINGLKYLYDYSIDRASEIMTSREWTRAIMIRDPKERFLSAFLDKSVQNYHRHIIDRCCPDESCVEAAQTITGFLDLCSRCDDDHWRPQSERLDEKYWPYIDHVLHVDSAAEDAEMLLKGIGAWEQYGKTGWGSGGAMAIFESKEVAGAGAHTRYAKWEVWKWYTPETEELVEQHYQQDYEHPLFNFTRGHCITCEP